MRAVDASPVMEVESRGWYEVFGLDGNSVPISLFIVTLLERISSSSLVGAHYRSGLRLNQNNAWGLIMGLGDGLRRNRENPKVVTPPDTWSIEPSLLIVPNIPKPMHGVVPRTIKGRSWWDKYRKEVYASTDYHCKACGVSKWEAKGQQWLEAHETYDIDYKKARMTFLKAVPLCTYCHHYIHDGRMASLVKLGKMSHAKYAAVIQHGDAILAAVAMVKPTPEEVELRIRVACNGNEPRWGDWRMVFEGIEYPPIYQSYGHWLKAMGWL